MKVASDELSNVADEESSWMTVASDDVADEESCRMKCVCAPFKSFWEMILPYMLNIWNLISVFVIRRVPKLNDRPSL